MFRVLTRAASRVLNRLGARLLREHHGDSAPPAPTRRYEPLGRVLLTDQVAHTLFDEYASHRKSERGHEETGWLLLGLREPADAVVLATLPAGAQADAGIAHVHFNSTAQALASRIVRQSDRRMTILGVVHTHPGSLRHPSRADLRGDLPWSRLLRGEEGIFGIGTADGASRSGTLHALQPRRDVILFGDLRLSWYTLSARDRRYRRLPCDLTLGPDLARPLHSVWDALEIHAERLERLWKQQTGLQFEVVEGKKGKALAVTLRLAEPGHAVRVLIEGQDVRYFVVANGSVLAPEAGEARIDRAVYLMLAELAGRS